LSLRRVSLAKKPSTALSHEMLFVQAYPRESQEMVLDTHDRAFAFFRGACTRGIYDIEPLLRHWSERQWRGKTAVDAILSERQRWAG
jgi:hypothetical protein